MIVTDKDVDFMAFIGEQESQEVKTPTEFKSSIEYLIESGDSQSGESLPWSKMAETQKLRKGELSIWGGVNGHGKSLIVNQVILHRMQNQRAIIASLEMTPAQTLYRMICQHNGCRPSQQAANEILDTFDNRLWIYDQLDTVQSEKILGMVHWAAHELAVEHVVIDSLAKCGVGRDDYEKQARFVDRLQWAAKSYGIHIHLVCHMRKKENENARAGKFDLRGAAEISDYADNIFIIHRNKKKEAEARKEAPKPEIMNEPDTFLAIEKNRHGGKEGLFGLFYHDQSYQFLANEYSTFQGVLPPAF